MSKSEKKIKKTAANRLQENTSPELTEMLVQKSIAAIEQEWSKNNNGQSSGRVILTAFGCNNPGIVSSITASLSKANCDILDISQKIMQEFFTMIMLIDITNSPKDLKDIQNEMNKISADLGIKIFIQHEDVFRYMHRI